MTTETPPMTRQQIRERLNEIAPFPEWGTKVTAEGVARYLAVCAGLGWARNVTPFITDDQVISGPLIMAQFAASHALLALAGVDPERAAQVTADITEAWAGGGGMGGWLWDHLEALSVDPDEMARLDAARLALENAAKTEQADELATLRNAAQTLGKIVIRLTQSMEAARIEMLQNGPEAAMQWILNSLPDVSDDDPEDQWDGTETATQWIDRMQAADRAHEAAAGKERM